MKIGLIREGKMPPDSRVALLPEQCQAVLKAYPNVEICVQPSPHRCVSDADYAAAGLLLQENMEDCDILFGIKEVPRSELIENKSYLFFSHTIKEQPYNRLLLQRILSKKIRLIDYEVLTNDKGQRVIAFGYWAGVVGAHNGLMAYSRRTGLFELLQMKDYKTYEQAKAVYKSLELPPMRIVVTGTGRVASGAVQVLEDMGIRKVSPADYLANSFDEPVYTQLGCADYARPKDANAAFDLQEFFEHPKNYESAFAPYSKATDILINCIYWDNQAPRFFSLDDCKAADFRIRTIADISCDIGGSVPTTLFASTIAEPVFGYNIATGAEAKPYSEQVIDMMTIDNLPSELPYDASKSFGEQLIESVLPSLLAEDAFQTPLIQRATIAADGYLGRHFGYLRNYVAQD